MSDLDDLCPICGEQQPCDKHCCPRCGEVGVFCTCPPPPPIVKVPDDIPEEDIPF